MTSILVLFLTLALEHYVRQGHFAGLQAARAHAWGRRYFQWGEAAWPQRVRWAPEAVLWVLAGFLVLCLGWIFSSILFKVPLETVLLFFCMQPIPHAAPPRGQYFSEFAERVFLSVVLERFAVLCWFALLGPFGALMYYLCAQRATSSAPSDICAKVYPWLIWLPAQITGFIFACIGSFSDVWKIWSAPHPLGGTRAFLRDCGLAALKGQAEDPFHAIPLIVGRSAYAWVILCMLWLLLWR